MPRWSIGLCIYVCIYVCICIYTLFLCWWAIRVSIRCIAFAIGDRKCQCFLPRNSAFKGWLSVEPANLVFPSSEPSNFSAPHLIQMSEWLIKTTIYSFTCLYMFDSLKFWILSGLEMQIFKILSSFHPHFDIGHYSPPLNLVSFWQTGNVCNLFLMWLAQFELLKHFWEMVPLRLYNVGCRTAWLLL
jgi:hypothetical protein